ncbi:MAG TPA: nucleotidyltransferase [Bacteroidales bacterium]|nr:nucleotidyltransferase [Bacteroidales bacterium]
MKPTLFILAAGMGSRYGGLKQLDGLGPNGETIMDYSVYDAVRAGFGKVVFVIRESFVEDFCNIVLKKYEDIIPTEVVFQDIADIPEGFTVNPERSKPWGTNHAVLMGKGVINEPFAVINADDFYGKESFEVMAEFLRGVIGKKNQYSMLGYHVGNTLSDSGTVARGVCEVDAEGNLTNVVERTSIIRKDGKIVFTDEDGKDVELKENTPVSMNFWGFTPEYFDYSEAEFKNFLKEHGNELKSEFFIPLVVNNLMVSGQASCKVLDTTSSWFGVTYADDRPSVVAKIQKLIDAGVYPEKLYK